MVNLQPHPGQRCRPGPRGRLAKLEVSPWTALESLTRVSGDLVGLRDLRDLSRGTQITDKGLEPLRVMELELFLAPSQLRH